MNTTLATPKKLQLKTDTLRRLGEATTQPQQNITATVLCNLTEHCPKTLACSGTGHLCC